MRQRQCKRDRDWIRQRREKERGGGGWVGENEKVQVSSESMAVYDLYQT